MTNLRHCTTMKFFFYFLQIKILIPNWTYNYNVSNIITQKNTRLNRISNSKTGWEASAFTCTVKGRTRNIKFRNLKLLFLFFLYIFSLSFWKYSFFRKFHVRTSLNLVMCMIFCIQKRLRQLFYNSVLYKEEQEIPFIVLCWTIK